jgi:hypothetical protein
MFLSDALSVIGVFLLGAASGGCVKYARYRGLVALCKQLTETSFLHATDGMLMAGHCAQCVVNERSTRVGRSQRPVSCSGEFSNDERIQDLYVQPEHPCTRHRAPVRVSDAWRIIGGAEGASREEIV